MKKIIAVMMVLAMLFALTACGAKKEATKENGIRKACIACGIALEDVTAFGDDTPDIGMLKLCGTGVAMGNACEEVKKAADIIIGSNDEDGIAVYLEQISAPEAL